MSNLAILVGNVAYRTLTKLECCHDDVVAVQDLLKATGKYEEIVVIEDKDADRLKFDLRAAVEKVKSPNELFFYFSGHGYQHETDFFYCATNFDLNRPNETGLSTSELHTLLRLADADLVVKVIDACNSGTVLIKDGAGLIVQNKGPFKHLIQIASCLESQNALAGNPLSVFTDKFHAAALRKTDGPIFYTDLISTLRDEFLNNTSQTPFFVSQQTGREQFVDDAKKLDSLRAALSNEKTEALAVSPQMPPSIPTLLERLRAADAKIATPKIIEDQVDVFFNDLLKRTKAGEFADYFDVETTEHAGFQESTAEKFIIRVLEDEKRADNFVTARHTRTIRPANAASIAGGIAAATLGLGNNTYFDEEWTLRLNCTMTRTQLRFTFTPKFNNLKRVILVISCAPSLDHCYIFEQATAHALQDFGKFNGGGTEISRRWWKIRWKETTEGIVKQIAEKLRDAVSAQLEEAEKRLSAENKS
jgi:hypothetical protein